MPPPYAKPDYPGWAGAELVISTAAQHRPLWMAYAASAPSLIFLPLAVWGLIYSRRQAIPLRLGEEGLLVFTGSILLPLVLWRNRLVFNRARSRVVHSWGYFFWTLGRVERDLREFHTVTVSCVKPYISTLSGRVTPPVVDGFANNGRRLYYDVMLEGSGEPLLVQEFHSFWGAMKARRRLAEYLGLPIEPAAVPQAFLSAWAHELLFTLGMPAGMIAGLAAWVVCVPAIASSGFGALAILFAFAAFPIAAIACVTAVVSMVPASCPRCGGKARLTWSTSWAPGLSWGGYLCGACGARWTPSR